MITQLTISGLAIIDSLSIEFSPGFNVITGETGAGKSILIKALNLLMGGKASADAVRKGNEQAIITGEFLLPKEHPALIALENLGIPCEKNGEVFPLLVRRQITSKGRSQSWINDVSVTTQPLRELGSTLVDVFGQHENQRLMDSQSHTAYLDTFLKDNSPKARVERLSAECSGLLRELVTLIQTFFEREKNRDYLSFRLEALKKFEPTAEDFEKVSELCKRAERIMEYRDALAKALECIESGDEGLGRCVREAGKWLTRAASPTGDSSGEENVDPKISELRDRALQLATELDDLSFELGRLVSSFDIDEGELEEAQERLYGYQDLFRKHSTPEIAGLLIESERLQAELDFVESAEAKVDQTLRVLAAKAQELKEAAAALAEARSKAAGQIKKYIDRELHELAMPGSRFQVEFSPVRRSLSDPDLQYFADSLQTQWRSVNELLSGVSEHGSEKAQFLLASNPGEPMLPLNRIASGGELSRIMLAFKKTLAADAETCVLVFDEIDTGISGRVADVVGRKMQELASSFQVICISHLPQVAVYADSHFLVQKVGRGERTETNLVRLSREESAREIARLLSGAEVSNPSLANAKSLIEKARAKKPSSTKVASEARMT